MMNYSELCDRVGKPLADKVCQAAGKSHLITTEGLTDPDDSMTFDQWREIYRHAPSGSTLESKALEKMVETAKTFDQWREIYRLAPSSTLEAKDLEMMGEFLDPSTNSGSP